MNTIDAAVEEILARDRVWSAYALADLDPEHREFSSWFVADQSLILLYKGLKPPVIFTHGDPSAISGLIESVPEGHYQISCKPDHYEAFDEAFAAHRLTPMWRMVYRLGFGEIDLPTDVCTRLDKSHLKEIQQLIGQHDDAPDAFKASQLQNGIFYGSYKDGNLIALSGTHVLSRRHRLAAIGNVFTDPAHRNQGYASLTSEAVVRALLFAGVETIVLNVAKDNEAAIKTYKRIGFHDYCEFIEGYGKLVKR